MPLVSCLMTFGPMAQASPTVAVTATREDSNARGINGNQADNSAEDSGAAYVFARAGGKWSQQAYVKASNTDAGDQFGWSVTLSDDGNTMAVGAPTESSNACARRKRATALSSSSLA